MTAHPDKPHWWRHADGVENVLVCIYDGCRAAKAKPDSVVRSVGEQCSSRHPQTRIRCEQDVGGHRFHRAGGTQWFEVMEKNDGSIRCSSVSPATGARCTRREGGHSVHEFRGESWDDDSKPQCQSINPHQPGQAIQCEYPEGPHTAHKRGMWLWWDARPKSATEAKRTFTVRTAWASPTVDTLKNFLADLPSEAKLTIAANGNDYTIAADWSA